MLIAPLTLVLAAAGAGVSFEQTTRTVLGNGTAGTGVVSRVFYSGRQIRLEAGGAAGREAFVLRLDQGRAYRLFPERRQALELDIDRVRAQAQMGASMAGDLMGMGAELPAPRKAALPGSRVIAGYTCRGYRLTAGATVMDVWLAAALPVGMETFAEFLEWTGAGQSLGGLVEALRALTGFPLETRTRVNVLGEVHETISTVTRVTLGALPPALFEIPLGYTVIREAP